MLLVALIALAATVVVFLLDRFQLWAERRGWVHYRKTKGTSAVIDVFRRAKEQESFRKVVRPSTDPPFGVDLDAGTARISLRPASSPPGEQREAGPRVPEPGGEDRPGTDGEVTGRSPDQLVIGDTMPANDIKELRERVATARGAAPETFELLKTPCY